MNRIIFNIAAKCDKAGRSENQDNFWICPDLSSVNKSLDKLVGNDHDVELSEKGALLVVADGMGGMNAGEKASEIIITTVKDRFSKIPDNILSNDELIQDFIKKTIIIADSSIKEYAKAHKDAEGLGSTIVLLWLLGEKAYCAWCGDSRIYRFNPNNEIVRLSHDHSYVQGLVDEGKLTAEDAFDHPDGNIITRSLGDNGEDVDPEIRVYDVCERDMFLLCSDGLCGLLQDKEIEDVISTNCSSTKDALAALWQAGTKAGWTDNATIDLLYVINGGKRPKGIAVGYSNKSIQQKNEKNAGWKRGQSSESTTFTIKKPYIYAIIIIAIILLSFVVYKTLNKSSEDNPTNLEFTLNNGDNSSTELDNSQANNNSSQGGSNTNHNTNTSNTGAQLHNTNQSTPNNQQSNHTVSNSINNGSPNATNGIIQSINNHNSNQSTSPQQPDNDYLNLFSNVDGEFRSIKNQWRIAASSSVRSATQDQIAKFRQFVDNVNGLNDKNKLGYRNLDAASKNKLDSWIRLANTINENINKISVIGDEQQDYGVPF